MMNVLITGLGEDEDAIHVDNHIAVEHVPKNIIN